MHRSFTLRVHRRRRRPYRSSFFALPSTVSAPFRSLGILVLAACLTALLVWARTDSTGERVGTRASVAGRSPGGRQVPAAGPNLKASGALPVPLVLGYYDGGGVGSLGYESLVREHRVLSGIVPDWYEIWADGAVTGTADPGVVSYARAHGLWIFPLVQQNGDPAVFHALLSHPARERSAIRNLLRLAEEPGYDGVNLDFEGIAPQDRQAFTSFVEALANSLHAHGYYLTLSIPAETANDPSNSWSGAYSYRALGKAADLVMIMAYDDHYAQGSPGKVAPASWVDAVTRYAVTEMAPQKVVLGIPAYGYDWGPTGEPAEALSFGQAARLDNLYYGGRAGAHFNYTAGGVVHEVYFSDATTFTHELAVAAALNVRGIALWRLGLEDPTMWRLLSPITGGP